jgi:folate-binding protein YgfZ
MFSLEGYQAVHANGGVVRRSDRRVLAVSGADRASWLQGLLTNDVAALAEGESRYAAYLTPQGRMMTDLNVVSREGRLLLDVPANLAAGLRDRLDGLIFAEDVQVTDESGHLLVWTVIDGQLTDLIGESLPAEFKSLLEVDLDTFEVIRIERGVPRFLADMDEDTLPLEAGIEDRAMSFTKGCYVGQEIIVRVTTRGGGRVAKRLVRWHADDSAPVVPLKDARIFASAPSTQAPPQHAEPPSLRAGKDIGRVTSAAFSPSFSKVVGLGYVHRDFAEAGKDLTIVWNDTPIKAVVK